MENQELRQQYENYCKELKQKITDLQLENQRLQRENEQWKIYKEPKRDLEKQVAILQDGLEYHKDMADSYAKVLKRFENWLDCRITEAKENDENYSTINLMDLEELKNSIPETALRR